LRNDPDGAQGEDEMEIQEFKGPGRVTIDLVKPKKPDPFWRILLRIWLYFFIIAGVLKLLSVFA
jgi:hypothetical protein